MNITSQESMEDEVIYVEMPMFFFASNYCIWLIKSWVTNTTGYFFLGLIITFIFAFLGEGVNFLHKKYYPTVYSSACTCNESSEEALVKPQRIELKKLRIIKTAFTFIYYWWGIIDMLLLMTYNVYVIIALSLGISLGHFVFINPQPVKSKTKCSCDCCKK